MLYVFSMYTHTNFNLPFLAYFYSLINKLFLDPFFSSHLVHFSLSWQSGYGERTREYLFRVKMSIIIIINQVMKKEKKNMKFVNFLSGDEINLDLKVSGEKMFHILNCCSCLCMLVVSSCWL